MVHVTAFFAGLLALLYLLLTFRVIVKRYALKVAVGDGGEKPMTYRIRAHANFAEYVPLALLLMAFNELNGASALFLKIMGVALLAGRLSHAYSLSHFELAKGKIIFRQFGMGCTLTVIGVLAIAALVR